MDNIMNYLLNPELLGLLGLALTIYIQRRSDMKDRKKEMDALHGQLEDLFRDSLEEKLDGILKAMEGMSRRLDTNESGLKEMALKHARLQGRLEGKGVLPESN
jgi:hypothetical protein